MVGYRQRLFWSFMSCRVDAAFFCWLFDGCADARAWFSDELDEVADILLPGGGGVCGKTMAFEGMLGKAWLCFCFTIAEGLEWRRLLLYLVQRLER